MRQVKLRKSQRHGHLESNGSGGKYLCFSDQDNVDSLFIVNIWKLILLVLHFEVAKKYLTAFIPILFFL